MPREYYVYPNGTSIAVAGNNEYATQIPMSANDPTDVYTAISGKADNTSLPASQGGTDLTLVTTGDKYNWDNNDASSKVSKSGDTMTGTLTMAGQDIVLGTTGSSSDDSGDIVWKYGDGTEKMRIWSDNSPTTTSGPRYRVYKSDGTSLYSGYLALGNSTGGAIAFGGYSEDLATNNTTDTWVPVMSNGKMQHRAIPAAYNSAPSTLAVSNANYLTTYASSNLSNNIACLQALFDTIPKSVGTAARLVHGSHSMAFGWFLSGYAKANAYGGWFVSDYGSPSWVGVNNGSWVAYNFIHSGNIGSQTVSKAGTCTGNAATATSSTYCNFNSAGTTTGTTAKNFTIPAAALEILVGAKFAGKICTSAVPKQMLTASNQELWLGGGRGGNTTAPASDSMRAVCNIKISGTTLTLQGVTTNNQSTETTSSTTWYVYYR